MRDWWAAIHLKVSTVPAIDLKASKLDSRTYDLGFKFVSKTNTLDGEKQCIQITTHDTRRPIRCTHPQWVAEWFRFSARWCFHVSTFQVIQQRDSYKSSSIGSGPQFYTKPPTSLPANQTIEFDEGPKITVFIGELNFTWVGFWLTIFRAFR